MASFKDHKASERCSVLVAGDSGMGKTGILASLANAGYNVRILDFDNGLDVLASYLTPEGATRVHFETLTDPFGKADAFQRAVQLIQHWKTKTEDLGPVTSWTPQDVLVIDTLTLMGIAAMRAALKSAGKKVTDRPTQPEWGDASRDIENVIAYLNSSDINCNLVVNTHIRFQEDAVGAAKGYPTAIGRTLPVHLPRYFNTVIRLDLKPGKEGPQRFIRTTSDFKMSLRNPAPNIIPAEMDFDMAKLFALLKKSATQLNGAQSS